jgi:peptidoglycan/LPS O-acetylase OafA/YrhL
MNRLNNLDYLRGIAALSIMLYYYLSWTFVDLIQIVFGKDWSLWSFYFFVGYFMDN